MKSSLSKIIAVLFVIIGFAGNAAGAMPGFNSSPVNPARYATNVGNDPFTIFIYEALKDYPNKFSNIPTRPMTEAEKAHEDKIMDAFKEQTLEEMLKLKMDRATALRSVDAAFKPPVEMSVIKNPPPGPYKSFLAKTDQVSPAVSSKGKVYEARNHGFCINLCYDVGSQEEAKAILREKMNLIRKLLNNDENWNYTDEAWEKKQNEKTLELNARLAKQGKPAQPLLELKSWDAKYFWPSKIDKERYDGFGFTCWAIKQPGSSRHEARVIITYIESKPLEQ